MRALLASKADVNVKTLNGDAALIIASSNGLVEVVRLLLAAKADMNVQDNSGRTALMRASGNGHQDVVQLLCRGRALRNANDDPSAGCCLLSGKAKSNARRSSGLNQKGC